MPLKIKSILAKASFGVSMLALACASTFATAQAGPPSEPVATSSLTVEALVLHRDDPSGTDFTGPDTVGTPFVLIRPSDLDPDWSGGVRAMFETPALGPYKAQIGGFYAGDFSDNREFIELGDGIAGLATNATYDNDAHLNPGADVNTSNSDGIYALSIQHETHLGGAEGNLVRALGNAGPTGLRGVAGGRFIHFREKLSSQAFDEIDDFLGTDTDIDRVSIKTKNNLVGVQIGLEGMRPIGKRMKIGGSVKAGLFANFVDRSRRFSSDDRPGTINDSLNKTGFAQAIEVNPRLMVHLRENMYFTIGGTVLWLNGVSEAGAHYRTVTDADDRKIRDDGNVLFYGGTARIVIPLN